MSCVRVPLNRARHHISIMISLWFFSTSSPLFIFLLLFISPSPLSKCAALPAGIDAILDPLLGDHVQVAPNLASHQQEAEKLQSLLSSVKSIKTPSGTVKCSCQTVSDDDPSLLQSHDQFPSDSAKTIEIEIYQPAEDEEEQGDKEANNDKIQSAEGQKAKNSEQQGESQAESSEKNKPQAVVRNSFSLDDGGDASVQVATEENAAVFASSPYSQDRVFNTEEPYSFLSFLSSLVSSSAQAQALSQSQQQLPELRSTEPEKIETEAELESAQDYDDLASYSDDVNVANHRMSDTVTTTSTPVMATLASAATTDKPVYKSFHTSELFGVDSVLPTTTTFDGGSEKMDSATESNNKLQSDFFLWDFIYADHVGKKKQLVQLGKVTEPFIGPRRRRRRRSLRGNGYNSPVVFVYPVGHNNNNNPTSSAPENSSDNEVVTPENKRKPELTNSKIQMRSDDAADVDRDEMHRAMQAAMDRAWQQYGPKGLDAPPVTPAPPSPVYIIPASQKPPVPPLPGESVQGRDSPHPEPQPITPQQSQQQELIYYSPPRPFLFIDRIFNPFQPMTSEWDQHVTTFQGPPPRPPEPGPFSRFLASYIDFEVNNHEAADLMRKVVFGIFAGFLIAGWIALGAALGIVPFKKLLTFVAGTHYDVAAKRIDKGKEFMLRDTTLAELTDKISLSLDADWLKRLEERVKGNERNGEGESSSSGVVGVKIPTRVFCCILPDEHTKGIVECQVTKNPADGAAHHQSKKKKTSAFKCITDLIYNFHFGPKEGEGGRGTGVVFNNTVKSKANNNNKSEQENTSESESVSADV